MENPMRVIMVENSMSEIRRFQALFDTQPDVELVGSAGTEAGGLLLVERYYPDVVVLDFQLEDGDGLQFLIKLHQLDLPFQPYIVVITWTTERRTIQSLKDHGAGYVQFKSKNGYVENGPQMILDFLREMRPYFKEEQEGDAPAEERKPPAELEQEKRRELKEYMRRIGVASSGQTNLYVIEAIWEAYLSARQNRAFLDMENDIYPKLEKKLGVKRKALERGIRARIESVWDRVDPDTLQKEFTLYTDAECGKPALKEFISYYVDKLNGE